MTQPPSHEPPASDLQHHTVSQLLTLHSAVLTELRRRRVCRSANNPTGDFAEWLVAERLGLTLETNSAKGFDAVDAAGTRYQIKARRREIGSRPTRLSPIRGLEALSFDVLIAVMFEPDWTVKFAARIPHAVVGEVATFKDYVNGHVMHLRTGLLTRPGVQDITEALRA